MLKLEWYIGDIMFIRLLISFAYFVIATTVLTPNILTDGGFIMQGITLTVIIMSAGASMLTYLAVSVYHDYKRFSPHADGIITMFGIIFLSASLFVSGTPLYIFCLPLLSF